LDAWSLNHVVIGGMKALREIIFLHRDLYYLF
jgi:hypothetical protein